MNCVFDDSGGSDTSFICIAGYVALDTGWDLFIDEWFGCLTKHRLPFLHMKDFIPMRGPYKDFGWSVLKRNEVLVEFAEIIKRRAIVGFAVGLDAAHYRKMGPKFTREFGDPRRFCVIRLLRMIVDRFSNIGGLSEILTLVFDDSEEMSLDYHRVVRELRKQDEYKKLIGSVCFADDEVYNPLQGADLLAWETTKEFGQRAGGYSSRPEFVALMGLEQPQLAMPYQGEFYGPEAIENLAQRESKG
ncbi:MAG: DUF3800 domain-containing protein [Candidatus Korobacteraceae bacterium]